MKRIATLVVAAILPLAVAACGKADHTQHVSQAQQVEKHAASQRAYLPHNDVELRNYNAAQKLYDSPNTIIWCSTTWGNASAPLVTVPVTGKLTSSTTSFFPSTHWVDRGDYQWNEVQSPSVDGMYHPNPPQYRYGFTPGGQYVDFFNMPTFCTTALTKFQRQSTRVTISVDAQARAAQRDAERALRNGDPKAAQRALAALNG